ncbi:MAG: anti-sigma factor family protein [Deltaproteobacteria bacterium]
MNCHDVREDLESYIAGDLEDREASEVARHLDACPACAAAYEETRLLVGELKDLSGAFRPVPLDAAAFVSPAASPAPRPRRRSWRPAWVLAAAVLLVVLAGAVAVATVPSLARTVPLPVGARLNDLQQQNERMRERTRAMEERVRALEERIKSLTGDDVNVVPTSEQDIPDEVTMAVQQVVIQFIKAQYAGDVERLKELSTPALDARIDERPEDYLRDNAGTVSFAQMTDVGIDENGLYLTFVRLSDTKVFSDSQYQENFAVEKSGDRYLVEYMETDA